MFLLLLTFILTKRELWNEMNAQNMWDYQLSLIQLSHCILSANRGEQYVISCLTTEITKAKTMFASACNFCMNIQTQHWQHGQTFESVSMRCFFVHPEVRLEQEDLVVVAHRLCQGQLFPSVLPHLQTSPPLMKDPLPPLLASTKVLLESRSSSVDFMLNHVAWM